jgi:hypothetical protein
LAGPKGKGSFKKGEWQEQHQQAFEAAKAAIAGAKLLSYLDYSIPIRLRTDACDIGAGAMLYQVVDGQDRPVSFMSHSFSASERRWSTFEQEAFAVVKAITHWDSLLLGHPFVVETDRPQEPLLLVQERQSQGCALAYKAVGIQFRSAPCCRN